MHLPAKQESDHSGIRGRDSGVVLSRGILLFPGCFNASHRFHLSHNFIFILKEIGCLRPFIPFIPAVVDIVHVRQGNTGKELPEQGEIFFLLFPRQRPDNVILVITIFIRKQRRYFLQMIVQVGTRQILRMPGITGIQAPVGIIQEIITPRISFRTVLAQSRPKPARVPSQLLIMLPQELIPLP